METMPINFVWLNNNSLGFRGSVRKSVESFDFSFNAVTFSYRLSGPPVLEILDLESVMTKTARLDLTPRFQSEVKTLAAAKEYGNLHAIHGTRRRILKYVNRGFTITASPAFLGVCLLFLAFRTRFQSGRIACSDSAWGLYGTRDLVHEYLTNPWDPVAIRNLKSLVRVSGVATAQKVDRLRLGDSDAVHWTGCSCLEKPTPAPSSSFAF
jgi:hypothetical protein